MRFVVYILLFIPIVTLSQTLTEGSMIKVRPGEGQDIVLYAAEDCAHCYYYLPSDLKVSTKPGNKIPEVSLTTWKKDESSIIAGGIFHFLTSWGLSPEREKSVYKILSERDSLAVIMGPVLVNDGGAVLIEGKDKLSGVLNAAWQQKPLAPTTPGAKMAFSFRFREGDIADFLHYVHHPEKTNTNLKATYTYAVKTAYGQERINTLTLLLPFKQILSIIKEK